MEALLNPEWLGHLCRALVECIETVGLVSHHYWQDPDGGWQVELHPSLMEIEGEPEPAYDLNTTIDIQGVLRLVDEVTLFQCTAEKISLCASFAGHEFSLDIFFEPTDDAEVAGRMSSDGVIENFHAEDVPKGD